MGNFCDVAEFTLYILLICKFLTFIKRLKKASAEINLQTAINNVFRSKNDIKNIFVH